MRSDYISGYNKAFGLNPYINGFCTSHKQTVKDELRPANNNVAKCIYNSFLICLIFYANTEIPLKVSMTKLVTKYGMIILAGTVTTRRRVNLKLDLIHRLP